MRIIALNAIRCLSLLLFALIFLFPWMLSKIPPDKATEALNKKITPDRALSLYTFYEGRVQSTKSILVGILAAILSLQIPPFLKCMWKKPFDYDDALSVIILCIPSLFVFFSLKLHMQENAEKSRIFQKPLCSEGIRYNPKLSKWKYKFRRKLPLGLDVLLILVICLLSVVILFWGSSQGPQLEVYTLHSPLDAIQQC
jgi:hypothetical protein